MKKKTIGYILIVLGALCAISAAIKAEGVFAKVQKINTASIDYESGYAHGLLASWIVFLVIALVLVYLGFRMVKKRRASSSTQN